MNKEQYDKLEEASIAQAAEAGRPMRLPPLTSPVPEHISAPSIAIIVDRIIRDVSLPMERVKEALTVCREMLADEARRKFDAAYPALYAELPTIEEKGIIDIGKGRPQSYAKLEDIVEAIKPILLAHGFGIRFRNSQNEKGITATCVLAHQGGHAEETPFFVPFDTSGSKNVVQGYGSSSSYAKRYALLGALSIVSRGQDNDGNTAGHIGQHLCTESELEVIKAALDDAGCESGDMDRFFKTMKINALVELRRDQIADAMQRIANFKALKLAAKATGFVDASAHS